MSIKRDILWRIYMSFGVICLFGLAILFQAFKIQVVEGEKWRNLADSLTTSYVSIEAERGNIYSEKGRLMATLLPYFEVRMDVMTPSVTDQIFYNKVDSLALLMANFFQDKHPGAYREYLVNARRKKNRYLLIKKKVTYPQLQVMKTWPIFRKGRYKGGLIVLQKNKRVNPFGILAHRTIGYVREGVQPVGLEGKFNEELFGVEGKRLMQRIAGNVWIPINDKDEITSQNGYDLHTTLNVDLQDVVENALLKALEHHGADHGSVVVMEVRTGKIKAMANLGKVKDGQYWELYNYAVGESTEPGSTFKLASIMALLKEGKITIQDSVDLQKGHIKYYDKDMYDSHEHDYRNVTAKKAFEISSNVGISKLVTEHFGEEPEKFIDLIYGMRLNQKTGIEIEGESEPFINKPGTASWSGVALPWMSEGYGVKLTPLQILTFYNAVANNGVMMKPYLVKAIKDHDDIVKKYVPVILHDKIADANTIEQVKLLLESVVENGTARYIKTPKYKIAGKTGTAQIADRKHGYQKVYQSSFVGYFPADAPQYSCIVVVNSPTSGVYYGSVVAAPVFREIADKIYATNIVMHTPINKEQKFLKTNIPYSKHGNYEDIQRVYNRLEVSNGNETGSEWVYPVKRNHEMELKEKKVIKGLIPNVVGMGLRDAIYLLENQGLNVQVQGKGRVRSQSIIPGVKANGQYIKIELS